MSHKMIVIAFPGEKKANEVLKTLKEMDKEEIIDLKSAGVVECNEKGNVYFKETKDFNVKQGAIAGAAGGALIGLLRGSLLKGAAAGAAAGAASGKFIDLGLEDDFLREVGEQLQPDSSAIVGLVDFQFVDPAMTVLDQFEGGTILEHELSAEVYAKLSEAVED